MVKNNKIITFNSLLILLSLFLMLLKAGNSAAFAEKNFNLTILHTNDVHGRLEPIDYSPQKKSVGGIARRATLIKDIRSNEKNVLVLDGGDIAQGTLFYKIFYGVPDMKILSEIEYDAIVLGNHEFDNGISFLQRMISNADFPVLSANLKFTDNKYMKNTVKPYIIKNYNGFTVGIIGITTSELKTLTNIRNGVNVFDDITTAKKLANQLKNKVDFIVVISHCGVDKDVQLAESTSDIDVIVGGHTHTFLSKPIEVINKKHKTLIVQNGEFGITLGDLDLAITDGEIKSYKYLSIPVNNKIKADEGIEEEVSELSEKIQELKNLQIGILSDCASVKEQHAGAELTIAGSLLTEAVKVRYPDADVVLQNTGGIRKSLNAGGISIADIYEFYPFNNTVFLIRISGRTLKSILETSSKSLPYASSPFLQSNGLEYTVDLSARPQILSKDRTKILKEGNRVRNIKVNRKPIKFDKYYQVAVNDFIYYGGDGYTQFKSARNVVKTGVSYQDLLIDYVKNNSPVHLNIKDKIHVVKYNTN